MIDQVKELLHESVEDQALTDEEVLEEHAYEESFQEDHDEAYHVEDSEEAFNEDEVLSLNDPNEDIQAIIPLTRQEEKTMSYDPFKDLDDNLFHDPGSEGALQEPSNTFGHHIDTFIQIVKRGWDMILFTFDGDPTYDVEGNPQTKDWSPCIYDSDVWDDDSDMLIGLFHPFKDDLTQCFQDDFQPSCSDFDRHQVVACPKQSKVHTTKQKYFHVETKNKRFLSPMVEFSSNVVPYPVSSCLGSHRVFFGSLVLPQPSGRNDILSEDENEP
jgi:hypothetical protein